MIHAATVDIAAIAARLLCRYEKPAAWAALHPAFRTARRPELRVAVVYDDLWPPIPWIAPGTASDRAEVEHRAGWARIRSDYYDLVVDPLRRRARLRMAPGFWVGPPLRALWSLLLLERGGLLLRARLAPGDAGATLVVGGPADASGLVAVRPAAGGFTCFATPFETETSEAVTPMPVADVRVACPAQAAAAGSAIATVRALAPHVRLEPDRASAARALDALVVLAGLSSGVDALVSR